MPELHPVWLGTVRVTAPAREQAVAQERVATRDRAVAQLDLLPSQPTPDGWFVLDQRERGTRFLALPVHSVLNTAATTRMPFWSINPYVGCEFGCTYCYARDTHRYVMERRGIPDATPLPPWQAFEQRILVKTEVAEVLARTLDPSRLGEHSLVIGTATDPYQPAERRFRLTRGILETLLHYRGLSIGLITKSPLVTRDLALLQALGAHHEVTVNISLATLDPRLARRLELRSPMPATRLRALARLTAAGVHAGLMVAPIIPGVTDDRPGLEQLMRAAKEAGAHYVVGSALRLGPAARHRFLPVLAREFPELAERYRRHFARSESTSSDYQRALARRLRRLQQLHGFPVDESRGRHHRQVEEREPRAPDGPAQPTLL